MPYCLISFGSNLGDRQNRLAAAATRLSRHPALARFRASRLFTTPAIGGPSDQAPFLNAVAAFETDATAAAVLRLLQSIELDLGRERKVRWDARSIDLDVVLYGDLMGGGANLIVPHPRYTARMFVLLPACDVVPHWRDPRFGWSLQRLTQHLQAASPSLALVGGSAQTRNWLCQQTAERLGIRWVAARNPELSIGSAGNVALDGRIYHQQPAASHSRLKVPADQPWIAAEAPPLPRHDDTAACNDFCVPRLLVRLQETSPGKRWPAPHQMWPTGGGWPEYRLEISDPQWAVSELVSAFDSLQCSIQPVTPDGNWY